MVSSRTPDVVNVTSAHSVEDNSATSSRLVVSDSDNVNVGDNVGEGERHANQGIVPTTTAVQWSQSGPPSLSMSVDLHNLVSSNLQDSGRYSTSPEGDETSETTTTVKVSCHDEEESYEGFGSVEGDIDDGPDSPGGSSSAPSPTGNNSLR